MLKSVANGQTYNKIKIDRSSKNDPTPKKLDQKSNDNGGRFFMAKYSYETKLQAVHEYINGEGSHKKYLAKKAQYTFLR